ncbi:MAG: dihydrofolate reductase [Phycisphaerales bacterium]|jgi:dihydrofolate reductase|nr:dihydrofolate reductase [Phycisphaerales bacterium]
MELVVAMTTNNVIGKNGSMPWHLPADLAHFKQLTSGHAVIMGRRTWESIGKPLPNRCNIVVTRQPDYVANGATVVHGLQNAIIAAGNKRVFSIGGGEIYAASMEQATRLHVTRIDASVEGDTVFPPIDATLWKCTERKNRPADDKNQYALCFETWERIE